MRPSLTQLQRLIRAAILTEHRTPLIIKQIPAPTPTKGQLLIQVHACGLNSIDLENIAGRPRLPFIPGYEVCGETEKGQRVVALLLEEGHSGGLAEEVVVAEGDAFPVDMSLPFTTGASLLNSYATALLALTRRGEVEEGMFVVVTGAAGRLGLATVDLASSIYRCKVIAVCSSDSKADLVRERGAWATITMGKQDLFKEVMHVTEGKGVGLVIDVVGGKVFGEVVRCLSPEGRLILAGFASTKPPTIDPTYLMQNSISVLGVDLEQYRLKNNNIYRSAVQEVIEMCGEGLIRPLEPVRYPLEKVNDAVEVLGGGASLSKVVVDVR